MTSTRTPARVAAVVTAVAATVAAVLVAGPGYDAARVHMRSGAVWLASNQTGEVSFVDGTTGEVRARTPVAEPGTAMSVSQQGGAVFVANRKTGQLSRVDSASEQVTRSGADLPTGAGLVVKPGRDVVYGVDVHSGTVMPFDPDTMRTSGEQTRLAGQLEPDSVVLDGNDKLWAIDAETGDLVWLADGQRRSRPAAARNGRLAITEGRPALVDPARGTAELLHVGTGVVSGTVRPDLAAGDVVAVSGSPDRPRLLIANGTRGELVVCAFDTRSCADPVRISAPGAELGHPAEIDDHAVVPDHSTGQATIVNLATGRIIAQRQLFDQPARFELIVRDGIVFFNDPDSARAGVLDLTGEVRTITKHLPEPSADDNRPDRPDADGQADLATKVGRHEHKQGLSLPGQAVRPVVPNPGVPSLTAPIAVKPDDRGEVGDEFELTAVLQPATAATVRWSFGDGAEAEGTTVRHTWTRPGTFTVRATAAGAGEQVSAQTTVTVDPPGAPPHVAALAVRRPKPVIGESVHFSAVVSGNPDRWTWTVTRPGQPAPEVSAQTAEFDHRFSTPGRYTVSLTIARGTTTATSSQQFTVARGAVGGWGQNRLGALVIPPAAASGVIAIDAGTNHALALKADGSVITWGDNFSGQQELPPEVSSGVIAISAGQKHSLALKADGTVVGWGGRGESGHPGVPPAAQHEVIAIAAGQWHSLALKKDGSVVTWGRESARMTVPIAAKSDVVAISAGARHSMALRADGSVVAWGSDPSWPDTAAQVPPEAMSGVIAISAEYSSCLALKSDGSVVRWGSDDDGRLSLPPEAQSGVIAIDTFDQHALALKADGSVIAWGWDQFGPVTVPSQYSSGVLSVAAGRGYSLVLLEAVDS
ncbi:PKD domain-containing protein [Lentzea sp. NPDC054927]